MTEYSEPTGTGDVIGVYLDFQAGMGTLSFSRNGKMLGTAWEGLSGPLYPAVSLYYCDASVTIGNKIN